MAQAHAVPRASGAPPSRPLQGLRVLDLTHYLAGPFCTKLLADYGADVVKVERPGDGDGARRLGPFPNDLPDPERSGHFLYLNTNKRGVTLNLKTPSGADLLRRLVGQADVLVDNFRPGTLERLGLGTAALRALNPRLITCSITNFGASGPYRDYLATEMVLQAMAGFVYGCGDPRREPLAVPFPVAQYIAGLHAYIAILAAEMRRTFTDVGEHIDISIVECLLSPAEPALTGFAYNGHVPRRVGRRRKNLYPGTILPSTDGFVAVLVVTQAEWKNLAELMQRPDLVTDPRFATAVDRIANADAVDEILTAWFKDRPAREIYRTAQQARVPFAVVATAADLLESEHLAVRSYFQRVTDGSGTPWTIPGASFRLSDCPSRMQHAAPRLGQHNAEVFGVQLGLRRDDLRALTAVGAI